MKKLYFFMMTTANGLYERGPWQIDWHNTDGEFNDFAIEQLDRMDTLVFGRKTYEGMVGYWTTPEAIESDPIVAGKMNGMAKVVVSKTLARADWSNTRVVRDPEAIAALKREPGKDALLIGSSDLAVSLGALGLIDEYRIMVNPIALGNGKPVLQGLAADLKLRLLRTRTFTNGNVLLTYAATGG
ncbi:MAG TPA: dihydrofolate reductase family protein [Candidatus Saccharimonadales bacterium]|jgi:dihydrofolate reductase|nr:dihydrofolate reductase family protein [Candidatus Saccharimonadales bacterium]